MAAERRQAPRGRGRLGLADLGQVGVPDAGEALLDRQRGLAVPEQDRGGRRARSVLPPDQPVRGDRGGLLRGQPGVGRVGRSGVAPGAPHLATTGGVHRLVGEPVGVLVLLPRDPGEADRREPRDQRRGLPSQRLHVGVLDLPAARHLLDDQLGVHPYLDLGGADLERSRQPGDQAAVLRDVVGRPPDAGSPLGEHVTRVRLEDDRAVAGRTGVAPRPAVCLHGHSHGRAHSPDSAVRTRIRRHSWRRTSSTAAARYSAFSFCIRSRRHAPQRPRSIGPAPTPPSAARIFS